MSTPAVGCSFDQDLSDWDVSNVESFYRMFWNCASFSQVLTGYAWCVTVGHEDQTNMLSGAGANVPSGSIESTCSPSLYPTAEPTISSMPSSEPSSVPTAMPITPNRVMTDDNIQVRLPFQVLATAHRLSARAPSPAHVPLASRLTRSSLPPWLPRHPPPPIALSCAPP